MRITRPLLSIFGGMGPEATIDLYRQVIELTPAEKDQDHIPTLIYSLPQVPERTASIRNRDQSIIPFLVEGVTRLEKAGASFIAIPCNTAHYYINNMQEAISIPIIHMIRETVNEVVNKYPDVKRIGLLATTGTIESKLYDHELDKKNLQIIIPDEKTQNEKVMKAVFEIKARKNDLLTEDLLVEAGQYLIGKGAELIILGCTEIPLAFNNSKVNMPVVNASRVLAERAVRMYFEIVANQGMTYFQSGHDL